MMETKGGEKATVSGDQLPGTFFGPPNLVQLVRHRAAHQPDDIAFVYLVDGESEEIKLTNRELDRQARAIAAWLQSLNLQGERALLLYPPGLEFIAAFFGCLYAGVVAVPVYPPRRNRSLQRIQAIAADAEARVALTTDVVLRRVEGLIEETPDLKRLHWLATCHVPEGIEQRWEMPDIHTDTLAFLQYTSGSTGTPKGVMLNHGNLIHNSALIAYVFEHTRSGLGVFWLPSYHDMGLIGGILQPLYVGRPNILMSPMAFLQKPFRWLWAITRYRATTSGGPNFAYELCVRKITPEQRAKLDLSSWQVAFNGAEPVRAETIEKFIETFEPCGFRPEAFFPCFGLAEATLIVSGGYAKEPPVIRWYDAELLGEGKAVPADPATGHARALVGCGQCLPDQQIVIADPKTLTKCPDRVIGEIWVKGPSVAMGYWRRPDVTREVFQAYLRDTGEGPFLRTGDLGFLDGGELFVTGRIKDVIILRGVNIYPQDIELTVQNAHPWLRPDSGAAFTIEDDSGRQKLIVVQELERRIKGDLRPVFQAIRRAIAQEHDLTVDAIVLVKAGSIPKTSSNKIQRHACRDGYLAGTLQVVAQWDAEKDGEEALAGVEVTEASSSVPSQQGVQKSPAEPASKPGKTDGDRSGRFATVGVSDDGSKGNGSYRTDVELAKTSWQPRQAEPTEKPQAEKPPQNGQVAEVVLELLRQVAQRPLPQVDLDAPISELGLDSVEKMELVAGLESRFGGRIPEEALADLETCRDVIEAVERHLVGSAVERFEPAATDGQVCDPAQFPEYIKLQKKLEQLRQSSWADIAEMVIDGPNAATTVHNGRTFLNFLGYDYLGLATEENVVQSAQQALERLGTTAFLGSTVRHQQTVALEQQLVELLGTEQAMVVPGGVESVVCTLGHLLGRSDAIFYDAALRRQLGALLQAFACQKVVFPHADTAALEKLLDGQRGRFRRVLIFVEGLSPIEGDTIDLPALVQLKEKYKAMLAVDESHSLGTLGNNGLGACEFHNVQPDKVDIRVGSLAAAFSAGLSFAAGRKELIELLRHNCPSYAGGIGLSNAEMAIACQTIAFLQNDKKRIDQLHQKTRLFVNLLAALGIRLKAGPGPIVSVVVGNSIYCLRLVKMLHEEGVLALPIVYPKVEEPTARVRFVISAAHTQSQIEQTAKLIGQLLAKIDPNYQRPPSAARPVISAGAA